MQSMLDGRQWLAWLVKVRLIILTLLLGIELAIARLTPAQLPVSLFVSAMFLWYTLSAFYLILPSFWNEYRVQSTLQVVTDLLLVTAVVYLTGGVDSSLNFLYPLVIIVAAILLPRFWAYGAAALAFLLYGAVLELTFFAVLPSYSSSKLGIRGLQAIIIVNLVAYFAVAYLAGVLVAKLRQVDVRLKHTSGELENLQALHEKIIQAISGGLITSSLDGRITLVNAAAQRLLERTEDQLLNQPVHQLFLDPLPQIASERMHAEVRFIAANSYRKTFRVLVSPLVVPEGGIIGHVYTFDDLTEIRRLEREVRMQDRLAAVGRLAAAIAHEIRNPLTSIAGSVSMLSEIPDLSDEHKQLLQIVTRESERLNGIITDFLVYSRSKQYQFAEIDLVPLLDDTLTLLENRLKVENSGILVERRYPHAPAMTLADGDRMKQVFWNFCENAIRAMKNSGTLTINLEPAGSDWQIIFADTGPGIAPQMTEKIFEPFQSQFEGGTGLGLAIVYQIVQAHEGKVWARSKVGQGTAFVLRLRSAGVTSQDRQLKEPSAQSASQMALAAATGGRSNG